MQGEIEGLTQSRFYVEGYLLVVPRPRKHILILSGNSLLDKYFFSDFLFQPLTYIISLPLMQTYFGN